MRKSTYRKIVRATAVLKRAAKAVLYVARLYFFLF